MQLMSRRNKLERLSLTSLDYKTRMIRTYKLQPRMSMSFTVFYITRDVSK